LRLTDRTKLRSSASDLLSIVPRSPKGFRVIKGAPETGCTHHRRRMINERINYCKDVQVSRRIKSAAFEMREVEPSPIPQPYAISPALLIQQIRISRNCKNGVDVHSNLKC
jgi:hypothetical protein